MTYFGFWAPNSYYAKTSAVRLNEVEDGLSYVVDYLRTFPGAVATLPVVVVVGISWTRVLPFALRFRLRVVAWALIALLGAVIMSGGDSYSGGRFLALPAALGVLGLLLAWQGTTGQLRAGLLTTAVLLTLAQAGVAAQSLPRARHQAAKWPLTDGTYACVHAFADAIERAVPKGSVAETDYQILKYYADDLRVIDLYGLNDRDIAHRTDSRHIREGKLDLYDVIRRRPDAFLWGTTPARNIPMSSSTMQDVLSEFHAHRYFTGLETPTPADIATGLAESYLPASIPICGKQYNVFVRRDLTDRFSLAGFSVGARD
jgi:hypothetical protein